jgi:non-homologous end joining protein Ku
VVATRLMVASNTWSKKTGNRLRQWLADQAIREPVGNEDRGSGYGYSKGAYVEVDNEEHDIATENNPTSTELILSSDVRKLMNNISDSPYEPSDHISKMASR